MAGLKQLQGQCTPEEVSAACSAARRSGLAGGGGAGWWRVVAPWEDCFRLGCLHIAHVVCDWCTLQMYFMAKDELITIVPNFSLPTENGTMQCIRVGPQPGWQAIKHLF